MKERQLIGYDNGLTNNDWSTVNSRESNLTTCTNYYIVVLQWKIVILRVKISI